jgi:DNA-directed RNA polymerase subunit E'/Rpb7
MNDHLFEIKNMSVKTSLAPNELCKSYKNLLQNKISEKYSSVSIQNFGFIKKILKINEIKFEEIMKIIPNVNFTCSIQVLAYLPKVNDELYIKVDFIFIHGIYGCFEKIKILVPLQSCNNFELKKDFSSTYIKNIEDNSIIKKESIIKICLTSVRFDKNNYSCLAKI